MNVLPYFWQLLIPFLFSSQSLDQKEQEGKLYPRFWARYRIYIYFVIFTILLTSLVLIFVHSWLSYNIADASVLLWNRLSNSCHTHKLLLCTTTDISFRMSVFQIFLSLVLPTTFFLSIPSCVFSTFYFPSFLHFILSSLQYFILSNLLPFLFGPSFCLCFFLFTPFLLTVLFRPCCLLPSIKSFFLSGSLFFSLSFSLLRSSFLVFLVH